MLDDFGLAGAEGSAWEVARVVNRRILLVCSASLWCEGVERVLGRLEAVEVLGPVEPDDRAAQDLVSDAPDLVVIVDGDEGRGLEDSLTARILIEHPDLPVVRMTDQLRLYVSRVLPTSILALVSVIEELPQRSAPKPALRIGSVGRSSIPPWI